MMQLPENREPPTVEFGALRLWVHGRQFPEATDPWDGNWLRVTAQCGRPGVSVVVSGAILDTVSFLSWKTQLALLYQTLRGTAVLESVEPNLRVSAEARGATGRIDVRVEITPDHMSEGHWFTFDADQTYLPPVIDRCEQLLRDYPVRDPGGRGV
jgi:hypothetical protein